MTLQNNFNFKIKLFCYAILSKIVSYAILHKYIFVLLFDVSCRVGDFFDFKKKSKKSDLFDLNQIFFI